jgi:SAM-dependent methyltransferase
MTPYRAACRDLYLGLGPAVDYVTCASCGLVQQHPIPVDVAPFYADYPVHQRRSLLQRLARRWLQREVYHRPGPASGGETLLDFGCGDGVYLREVRTCYKAVVGYEPGEALAAALTKADGIPVYSDAGALAAEWSGRIDMITAHYVMEHVTDLRGTMALFARLLKPGGKLYIAVPNIRSWEARWFGRFWHGLDAPRHISFPLVRHAVALGEACGLSVTASGYATFPNTLAASIPTALLGRYHGLLFNALILPAWLVAALAPSGTVVYTLTRKASSQGHTS